VWLAPLFVLSVMTTTGPYGAQGLIALLVGAFLLLYVAHHRVGAMTMLVVLLPFSTFLLAGLYHLHVPAAIVRPLGFWKEVVVFGIVLAGVRHVRRSRWKFDALDWLALGYVAIGTAYMFFPKLFLGHALGATLAFRDRELGWRGDVLYLLLLFGARHADLPRATVDRLVRRAIGAITVIAAIGILEFARSSLWNRIAVKTFGVQQYRYQVLHQQPSQVFNLGDIRVYGVIAGHKIVRIGSVLMDDLTAGFVLAFAVCLVSSQIARGEARRWMYFALPTIWAALLFTQTRSAIIVGVVGTLMALRPQLRGAARQRIQFTLVVSALLLLAIPVILSVGVASRFKGDTQSDTAHRTSFSAGIKIMEQNPQGRGLATAAGAGQLAQGQGSTVAIYITESQYLQIGTQLGVAGLVLYVAIMVALGQRLRALRRSGAGDSSRAAMLSALVGFAVGGLLLQPFSTFVMAWPFWAMAGAAAGEEEMSPRPVTPRMV
jgi:hypothetical protein